MKEERIKFNIGDVVLISNASLRYDYYNKAFTYFNLFQCNSQIKKIDDDLFRLDCKNQESYKHRWIVIGYVMHEFKLNGVLYCLKNSYNEYLVIGENGLKLYKKKSTKKPPLIESIPKLNK